MTIASEITRLQGAKADIKTSIEGKGVAVPSSASIDEYSGYIDQISTSSIDDIFLPSSFTISNAYYNTQDTPRVLQQMGDTANADNTIYQCFFWLSNSDTTAYGKYALAFRRKLPGRDPTHGRTSLIGSGRFYFRPAGWRMKLSGNNIIFSALRYEFTSGTSSAKSQYYCCNYTGSGWSSVIDCGISDDIGLPAVMENRTTACGITAEESLSAINKVTLSIDYVSGNYYDLVATLNN